ncbi:hypothetical protein [Geoglobus sp.]
MGAAKLKHALVLFMLGIIAGIMILAVIEELENLRSPYLLIFLSIVISLILTFIYHYAAGRKLISASFAASFVVVLFIGLVSFTTILGFALMSEYSAYMHVVKARNAENCAVLTEKDLSEFPFLEKALNKAEKTGEAVVEINADYVRKLEELYGGCVTYKGERYVLRFAVT